MKRRTFLSAAAILGAASTLAACGNDSKGTTGSAGSELAADTTAELTLSYWDVNQTPTVEAAIAAFNKDFPNIKVTPSITTFRDYWTKLRTQAQGDNLPDVFWMNGPNIQLYASNGQLAELDDMGVEWDKYPKALVDLYSFDGKHYGIPKDFDTIACWTNKKMLADAGVEVPEGDWTWEEFHAAAKAVSDGGAYGVVANLMTGGQSTYYNTIAQAGGFVVKDGVSGYDDPATIEGLKKWAELIADGSMAPVQVMTDTSPRDLFNAQKAAMHWTGSWEAPAIRENFSGDKGDVIALPLPTIDGNKGSTIHGLSYVAASSSKNLAAAKKLVTYMASQESAETEAANGTAIPAYTGTQEKWASADPEWNLNVFIDAAENYAVTYPVSKNTAAWNEKENELLVPAFQGNTDVEAAAKQLATDMNALLAEEK
ncbi:MAG: sugar ABC transporter substrate-binding protein [Propionibacteriaceae bacterium]|nr:sugar ABC transporter substrate-binding protein [Propionibacteriaceae bacterium]